MSDGSASYGAVDAVIALALVLATVVLFLHLTSTDGEFSRYNPGWNGTSAYFDLLESGEAVLVAEPSDLAGRQNSTLLVIAPGREPTADEGTAYRAFVTAGNTLVIADDFGSGNELLQAVGASTRLDDGNLSSYTREFEISNAPVGYPVSNRTFVSGISRMVFNHPVAVYGGEPLVNTSYLSWVDKDGDGRANSSEPLNRYPVMTEEAVGEGRVIVIGDASLFINAMQGLSGCDNRVLLARLAVAGTLVDQGLSQTAVADGPISTFLWIRKIPSLVVVVTAMALGMVAWSLVRRQERRKR